MYITKLPENCLAKLLSSAQWREWQYYCCRQYVANEVDIKDDTPVMAYYPHIAILHRKCDTEFTTNYSFVNPIWWREISTNITSHRYYYHYYGVHHHHYHHYHHHHNNHHHHHPTLHHLSSSIIIITITIIITIIIIIFIIIHACAHGGVIS